MTTNTSDSYRREAERLLTQITNFSDEARQYELLQMARQYLKMAGRLEAREEKPEDRTQATPAFERTADGDSHSAA